MIKAAFILEIGIQQDCWLHINLITNITAYLETQMFVSVINY